ncbi:hypothetical protein [Endozoicomonas lisbonensis]|uniref:Uncharacterized protein n=1 Tax=Endozoicomonas lisbonensis TaxID=3120522 RepID=A0ABV2SCU8_9GAMM
MIPAAMENRTDYRAFEDPNQDQVQEARSSDNADVFGRDCSVPICPERQIQPRITTPTPAPSLLGRCIKAVRIPLNALGQGLMSGMATGLFTMAIAGLSVVVGKPFGHEGINFAASYPLNPLHVGFKVGVLTGAVSNVIAEIADLPDHYLHQAFRDTAFTHVFRGIVYGSLGAFALGYPVVASSALGVGVGMYYGLNRNHNFV